MGSESIFAFLSGCRQLNTIFYACCNELSKLLQHKLCIVIYIYSPSGLCVSPQGASGLHCLVDSQSDEERVADLCQHLLLIVDVLLLLQTNHIWDLHLLQGMKGLGLFVLDQKDSTKSASTWEEGARGGGGGRGINQSDRNPQHTQRYLTLTNNFSKDSSDCGRISGNWVVGSDTTIHELNLHEYLYTFPS